MEVYLKYFDSFLGKELVKQLVTSSEDAEMVKRGLPNKGDTVFFKDMKFLVEYRTYDFDRATLFIHASRFA